MAQSAPAPLRAPQTRPGAVARLDTAERELEVYTCRSSGSFWQYEGTRAQLEAEGVIPPCTEWPHGRACVWWTQGRLRFRLCRKRPLGAKGPASAWAQADWWCLHCVTTDDHSPLEYRLQQLAREIARARYESTPAGYSELRERRGRYLAARADKAFQAFRAALLPRRRKVVDV